MRPIIILTMIVKDEAHCIERAIRSALPHVDHWVIVDTGSTDGTQGLILELLNGVPGALFQSDWKDFGTNRTELAEKTKKYAERVGISGRALSLLLDADDEIVSFPTCSGLNKFNDAFEAEVSFGPMSYPQIRLIWSDLPWRWEGVTHERICLTARDATTKKLEGFRYRTGVDSARRKSGRKTKEDIELLEKSLADNPDNPREVFYLANCYRDDGQFGRAADVYAQRLTMRGFDEELYVSAVRASECLEKTGDTDGAYLAGLGAINLRPWRAEAYLQLAGLARRQGAYGLAHSFAKQIQGLPEKTDDRLFVDVSARGWRGVEEYVYGCSYIGDWAEQTRCLNWLVEEVPDHFDQIVNNCNKITAR